MRALVRYDAVGLRHVEIEIGFCPRFGDAIYIDPDCAKPIDCDDLGCVGAIELFVEATGWDARNSTLIIDAAEADKRRPADEEHLWHGFPDEPM